MSDELKPEDQALFDELDAQREISRLRSEGKNLSDAEMRAAVRRILDRTFNAEHLPKGDHAQPK